MYTKLRTIQVIPILVDAFMTRAVHFLQVQTAIYGLRESAASNASQLQQEMSDMREDTATVKADWTVYVEKNESQYLEDTSAVESGKKGLEDVLHDWYGGVFHLLFSKYMFQLTVDVEFFAPNYLQSEQGKDRSSAVEGCSTIIAEPRKEQHFFY